MLISLQPTRDCYREANQKPLRNKQEQNTEYVIPQSDIHYASDRKKDITVVLIYSCECVLTFLSFVLIFEFC